MIDPVKLQSPFSVGDHVQPKEASDLPYLFTGERTPPGPIVAILNFGAHMVQMPDGRQFPFGPHELELADA